MRLIQRWRLRLRLCGSDPLGCRSGGSVGSVRYADGCAATSSPAGTVGSESRAEAGGISPAGTAVGCETAWTPWKPVRRVSAAAAEPGDKAVEPDAVCMTGMRAAHRRTAAAAEDPQASRLAARTPRLRGTCSGDLHLGLKSAGTRNGFIQLRGPTLGAIKSGDLGMSRGDLRLVFHPRQESNNC